MKKLYITVSIISALLLTSCITLRDSTAPEWNIGIIKDTNKNESEITETDTAETAPSEAVTTPVEPVEAEAETDETEAEPAAEADTDSVTGVIAVDRFADTDISFLAVGDGLVHPNIYMDAEMRGTSEKRFDFLPMFSDIADMIKTADISFINQETVMAGEKYGYSGYPMFNAPQQLGTDMCELGFDIINIANNHMLDMGSSGLADTVDFWKTKPVTLVGVYENAEDAENIRIISCEGADIALLSYTYGTNGLVLSSASPIVIPYIDEDRILNDLEKAENEADITIVSMHWGYENNTSENDEQIALARLLADNGADVIIGHHSHCLQPIEWIETERGRTLCIYSLGNLYSGMAYPINQVAGVLNFRIVGDGDGGLAVIEPVLTPTVFYYGMDWFNTHIYLIDNYTESSANTHGVAISGYTLPVDKAKSIVTDAIASEFLPDSMK